MTGLLNPTADQLRRALGATLTLQRLRAAVIERKITPSIVQRVLQADMSKAPLGLEWLIGSPKSIPELLDEVAE